MTRSLIAFCLVAALSTPAVLSAQGRIKQYGRATVEFRSADITAVANYDYSQRNHSGAWLLIELALQATDRIEIFRNQLQLIGPDERAFPIATQQAFLEDQPVLKQLFQNASIWRRPLSSYFSTRPAVHTIQFFAAPGGTISDSAVTNLDEVATGDLLFKSPDGTWRAGTYRLVLTHPGAAAELPIALQ